MPTATAYIRNELRKHLFRTGSFTKPSAFYIGLLTNETTEVSGGGYARAQLDPSDSNWTAETTDGQTRNAVEIEFPTASADWGTITHAGIYDAASGGNMIFLITLSASTVVLGGGTARFPVNSLQITIAG